MHLRSTESESTRRIQQQLHDLKTRNRELEESLEINSLSLAKRDRLDERFRQMQENYEKEQQNYEQTISKMKNDMQLIKNEWQRKCQ